MGGEGFGAPKATERQGWEQDAGKVAGAARGIEDIERLAGERDEAVDELDFQHAAEMQGIRHAEAVVLGAGSGAANLNHGAGEGAEHEVAAETDAGGRRAWPQVADGIDGAGAGERSRPALRAEQHGAGSGTGENFQPVVDQVVEEGGHRARAAGHDPGTGGLRHIAKHIGVAAGKGHHAAVGKAASNQRATTGDEAERAVGDRGREFERAAQ